VHLVEQEIVDDRRDVDRRGAEEDAAPAELDEVHVPVVVDAEQEAQFVAQRGGASRERREIFGMIFVAITVRLKPDTTEAVGVFAVSQ
jgi:hypothetical protein